ncbi:MAG: polysaccharide biosynthesis protein [Mucilaginibacter sp.]|nr:polysaccharide biosynthesis protein [Mucilaginibacter sp.]
MESATKQIESGRKKKLWQFTKLIALTGSAQMIVQGIGLASGILIIRLLPTKEYAFYTLANTMLGTMTVLADGGISSGVMALGGKVWQDRQKLGVVINTGLLLRRKFAVLSLMVSLPALFYLLIHHGASLLFSVLIILSLIPAFYAALSDNLLEVASKLHQDIPRLQKNQVVAGIGRFLMITVSVFFFPWTFIAILGNGIPRMWANLQLKKMSADYADPEGKADPVVKKEILVVVKRTLPGAIYFCVSGQITIWLISIFGSTASIAHIGALGRLTTVLTVCSTLFATLVVPRFARLKDNAKILRTRFIQIQLALLTISVFIIAIVVAFPTQILWVLGKGYFGLNTEVLLITISSCLVMLAGITYSVMVARGWIIRPIINISINIIFQIILLLTMDLSKTKNVLMFSIVDFLLAYIILIIYFIYRLYKLNKNIVL